MGNLIDQAITKFGGAVVFDVHSMPRNSLDHLSEEGANIPQIVLGDCFGSSCDPLLSQEVFEIFVSEGFRVKKNSPFPGGFITKNYGAPKQNVHVIQIEIDRSLYMNERTITLHAGFFKMKKKLRNIINLLSDIKRIDLTAIQAAE